ncbi:MAG: phosphoribosylanthranilate isomerase [Gammaproteobacteria bacterium]|nr:phosphoribosylanthranilate isomerase [Gammaproteobacteria bacterium]
MSTFVKICGLRTHAAVEAAVDAGADALGFVFAESPRRVTPAEAHALCVAVPSGVTRVAVMRQPSAAEWQAVRDTFRPDWLQTEASDYCELDLGDDVQAMPVYRDTESLDEDAVAAADAVLFEAASSGVGQCADWDRAARLARCTRLMLAGGLDPDNVVTAIRQVRPWGVDVSSGVERARGEKDLARIAAFLQAVRGVELANED